MGILLKPYEISIWADEWDYSKDRFKETFVCVIGSNTMTSMNRAIEPNLTRNVNGTKKLSFQMYSQYKDPMTGEKVENPFAKMLALEKKVKLKYGTYYDNGEKKDRWYDFVVKNVQENSATHLVSYQLEDAWVQELSKNGYSVVLDTALENNIGTAKELAQRALEGTDWDVESEVFVEKIEDNLVYLKTTKKFTSLATHITDQGSNLSGGVGIETKKTIEKGALILAFYSSCKNKPHRFQFICLDPNANKIDAENKKSPYNRNEVLINDRGLIVVPDCQYYIEFDGPASYKQTEIADFFIPSGMELVATPDAWEYIENVGYLRDSTISSWYKGGRYGFSQKTEYIKVLDKYCGVYNAQGNKYYGYVENDYSTPTSVKNVITNPDFEGTYGWLGQYAGGASKFYDTVGAKIESVYGRFDTATKTFISAIDDLASGEYLGSNSELDPENDLQYELDKYDSYLKIDFPSAYGKNYPIVLNSGFYDNRTYIGNAKNGEKWVLRYELFSSDGSEYGGSEIIPYLATVQYDPDNIKYSVGLIAEVDSSTGATKELRFSWNDVSDNEFEKKDIRLVLQYEGTKSKTVYLKNPSLYKRIEDRNGNIMSPGALDTEGIIQTKYCYFKEDQAKKSAAKDVVINKVDALSYKTYIPVYSNSAEKVRTVSASESNYFNILQSIAETFECWLDLEIKRDSDGAIEQKVVHLRNYVGKDNFASFRYGVNLKDIQRTNESSNIVTKLIVKENNNEYAEGGFCTIARADLNKTGETCIYDFSYYHKQGLLNEREYLASMHYSKNPLDEQTIPKGPDVNNGQKYNLQNYVKRIKDLNKKILEINESIAPNEQDLLEKQGELSVQEMRMEAASTNLAEAQEDFYLLTGLYQNQIGTNKYTKVETYLPLKEGDVHYDADYGIEALNASESLHGASVLKSGSGMSWHFDVSFSKPTDVNYSLLKLGEEDPDWSWKGILERSEEEPYGGLQVCHPSGEAANAYRNRYGYILSYDIVVRDGALKSIGTHNASFKNTKITVKVNDEVYRETNPQTNVDVIDFADALENNVTYSVIISGVYVRNTQDDVPSFCIQPNRGLKEWVKCEISNIKLEMYEHPTFAQDTSFYFAPYFELSGQGVQSISRRPVVSCKIPAYTYCGSVDYTLALVDINSSTIRKLLTDYLEYNDKYKKAKDKIGNDNIGLIKNIKTLENTIETQKAELKKVKDQKDGLNKAFYERYSRFVQEGAWMSEEYVDDNKYYTDALSVLRQSCYPQASYSINVMSLSGLPGYEAFDFEVGDKTFAEDEELFGANKKEEVVISEMTENLDNPSKNSIRVQNFKNEFQDLFQKITAVTQKAEYNEGAYKKAVSLVEDDPKTKGQFISDALGTMVSDLNIAGQTTVKQDKFGLTLTDSGTNAQMRLIGGAILLSEENKETGQREWKTGLTPKGIAASLITSGQLNTGVIQIMDTNDPKFRWDSNGISAFSQDLVDETDGSQISSTRTFVRFDQHGIYGIHNQFQGDQNIDGAGWRPNSTADIDKYANFSLTWEGLKIIGEEKAVARIGKNAYEGQEGVGGKRLISVTNKYGQNTFTVDDQGNVFVRGNLQIGDGISIDNITKTLQEEIDDTKDVASKAIPRNADGAYSWLFDKDQGMKMWCGPQSGTPLLSFDKDGGKIGPISITKNGLGVSYTDSQGSNYISTFIGTEEMTTKKLRLGNLRIGDYTTVWGSGDIKLPNQSTSSYKHIMHWNTGEKDDSNNNTIVMFTNRYLTIFSDKSHENEQPSISSTNTITWSNLVRVSYWLNNKQDDLTKLLSLLPDSTGTGNPLKVISPYKTTTYTMSATGTRSITVRNGLIVGLQGYS